MSVGGTGSVIQMDKGKPRGKCRSWQLRVSVGKNYSTGRYRTRTKMFHGTYREAEAALREFAQEVEDGKATARAHMTFAEAAEAWNTLRQDPESRLYKSYNTTKKAQPHIKALCMHIGYADVSDITGEMLDRCYSSLMAGESPSNRKLSGTYVAMIHNTANLVFRWLVEEGVLNANPCARAHPPAADTPERKAIPPERMEELLGALDVNTGTQTAMLLDLTLGLRSCESCALDWSDIDFDSGTVSVRKSANDAGVRDRTKTKAGMRTLPMTDDARSVLERRRAALERHFEASAADIQKKRREDAAPVLSPSTPVCCDTMGNRTHVHSVSTAWRRIRKAFDLDGFTPHELRHSYLSMLYSKGCDLKVLQKIAGHAKYSTTVDIYVHVDLDDMREAMSR